MEGRKRNAAVIIRPGVTQLRGLVGLNCVETWGCSARVTGGVQARSNGKVQGQSACGINAKVTTN